jgi:hypothetical protein
VGCFNRFGDGSSRLASPAVLLVGNTTGFAHVQQDMPKSDWSLVATAVVVSIVVASVPWGTFDRPVTLGGVDRSSSALTGKIAGLRCRSPKVGIWQEATS